MSAFRRPAWRIAGAAIACAVIVTPVTALAQTGSPARPAAAASRCATASLRVWLGIPGSGAAGQTAYQLELSNVSGRTCTLRGFPGVSAVRIGGGQLGSPATRDPADPVRLVTLRPGATAHVFLRIVDVAFLPPGACHPASALGLKVFPPGARLATVVPFGFEACMRKGPTFLFVRSVVAGTGIPSFSS